MEFNCSSNLIFPLIAMNFTRFATPIILLCITTIDVICCLTVDPNQTIDDGSCSGKLDEFLCNCLSQNKTIDIHLLPGEYNFSQQTCMLEDKARITITGDSVANTTVYCNGFNMVFINSANVLISNIEMVGCGNYVSDLINRSFSNAIPESYFGKGSRFTLMFIFTANVTITNLLIRYNLGYSIIALNALGVVRLAGVHIINTTFEQDENCKDLGHNPKTDFTCSGSGILFSYFDLEHDFNSALFIDNCTFISNKNIVPLDSFAAFSDLINTAFYREKMPLIGAGCIALYYVQHNFTVTTTISNTLFYNNNGTYSATVGIAHLQSTLGITNFHNCAFRDNNRLSLDINEMEIYGSMQRGGIVLLYFIIRGGLSFSPLPVPPTPENVKMLVVSNCSFIKMGGNKGAAVYIEKNSADYLTVVARFLQCNFVENEGDAGSAIFVENNKFIVTESGGGIQVNMTDTVAMNNKLSPAGTLEHATSRLTTGVFSFHSARVFVDCDHHCSFTGNQPSVFYGRTSGIVISGNAAFLNNTARFGGAFHLSDAFIFVHTGSNLLFRNNFATFFGGAIFGDYTNTNEQSEDYCPIQFVGSISNAQKIFSLSSANKLNANLVFENNFAVSRTSIQSIMSNVFYVCSWYPDTITQIKLGREAPVINGTRASVYHEVLTFIPAEKVNDHLLILADLPCLCGSDNNYNVGNCLTKKSLVLNESVVPGRSFNLSIIALDVVGSIGFSDRLFGDVYHSDVSDGLLQLAANQYVRPFFIINRTCTTADFTVFPTSFNYPNYGILELSLLQQFTLQIFFNLSNCSEGFLLKDFGNGMFGCTCDSFFSEKVNGRFSCDATTGNITRHNRQAWLSVIDGDLQYGRICSPTYCHEDLISFDLSEEDVLCTNHHSGRVCGGCEDGFSRVFGSDTCKKCGNAWLATIVLYAILGIVLVLVLFALKFTVTMGTINGVIFFCNVMSINEHLFFNTTISRFSFLRVYISIINLDLGFELCFYNGMSQLAKTGLQFVFPVYLWLIMLMIIFMAKRYLRDQKLSSYPALPVLATLTLLSYQKILRAVIRVFSFTGVVSSSQDNIFLWQPDPTVHYLTGHHITLFVIAIVFLLIFIFPFVICFTFPSFVLRSKWLSSFFPMFDSFMAPYKVKYRYWFGLRAVLLLYLSLMEAVIFSFPESLLLSSIIVVGVFMFAQGYIHPYKTTLNNITDLVFMGLFFIIATVSLFFYPSVNGYEKVTINVKVCGYVSFVVFCLVVLYHCYYVTRHKHWNVFLTDHVWRFINNYKNKYDLLWEPTAVVNVKPDHDMDNLSTHKYQEVDDSSGRMVRFRESLLEYM